MSHFRIARTYDVQGRRLRLPGLLERTPPGWELVSSCRRLAELPPPPRVRSVDELALVGDAMRTSVIAAVEIQRPVRGRNSGKYQALFDQVRILKAGSAVKVEFDDEVELRRVMNAVRGAFQSNRTDGIAVRCTINRALKTGYVERVPPAAKRVTRPIAAVGR